MRVLVTTSAHFAITDDGALWTPTASMDYTFWARYLEVFDEACLLVRADPRPAPPEGWRRATGPGIKPAPLPDSVGTWGFVRNLVPITRTIRAVLSDVEAVLVRIPCHIAGQVLHHLPERRPYGAEVVGDPYDVFAPGSIRHPLRPFFRSWFRRQLRKQCAGACATVYVTERALQRRYPPAPGAFTTHSSDVELPEAAFVPNPRPLRRQGSRTALILVGTLARLYKAPHVLLDAVAICVGKGLDLRLTIIGDGKYRSELKTRTETLGLAERVYFLGQLTAGDPVREQLDNADLFVLPSLTEGLPRAMIEAMARALPCIGSTVGGIPELLMPEDMVPAGDAAALACKIYEVVTAPERMARMSERNLARARDYSNEALHPRRISFYQYLRAETTRWRQPEEGTTRAESGLPIRW
jgi:glycosyltransferase involved in cell wall biosynthesis